MRPWAFLFSVVALASCGSVEPPTIPGEYGLLSVNGSLPGTVSASHTITAGLLTIEKSGAWHSVEDYTLDGTPGQTALAGTYIVSNDTLFLTGSSGQFTHVMTWDGHDRITHRWSNVVTAEVVQVYARH